MNWSVVAFPRRPEPLKSAAHLLGRGNHPSILLGDVDWQDCWMCHFGDDDLLVLRLKDQWLQWRPVNFKQTSEVNAIR